MSDEVLVKVEGVSKKFCRSLKRSLWYGVQDVSAEMFGRKGSHDELRKNEFWAVDDVSFELKRGECLGLIGPNGAGKSTLLKMLNGLVKPDKGRITMRGRVGALIELGAGFNPILTARENIYVNGAVLGFTKKEIDHKFDAIVDFAELEEFIDTPVQSFSSGMKVRLGFAISSQLDPDVLIIDEVLAVGDFRFKQKCLSKLNELRGEKTIILVSHSMDTIRMASDRVIVFDKGKLIFDGRPSEGISMYLEQDKRPLREEVKGDSCTLTGPYGDIFHNEKKIVHVDHSWSKAEYRHGETMEFRFSFRINFVPHRLIIGIPVWDEHGNRVTSFNSDHSDIALSPKSGIVRGCLRTTCHLNPGAYDSVVAILDGTEYLYRQLNPRFRVADQARLFGIATFPQQWETIDSQST